MSEYIYIFFIYHEFYFIFQNKIQKVINKKNTIDIDWDSFE